MKRLKRYEFVSEYVNFSEVCVIKEVGKCEFTYKGAERDHDQEAYCEALEVRALEDLVGELEAEVERLREIAGVEK